MKERGSDLHLQPCLFLCVFSKCQWWILPIQHITWLPRTCPLRTDLWPLAKPNNHGNTRVCGPLNLLTSVLLCEIILVFVFLLYFQMSQILIVDLLLIVSDKVSKQDKTNTENKFQFDFASRWCPHNSTLCLPAALYYLCFRHKSLYLNTVTFYSNNLCVVFLNKH